VKVRVFHGLILAASILLLLTYLAPWVSPRAFLPLALLAIAYPYFVLLNLTLAAVSAWRRRPEAWLSLGAVVLGAPYLLSYVGVHPPHAVLPGSIRLMTFNAKYFEMTTGSDRVGLNTTIHAVESLLRDNKPAVLCTQDFTGDGIVDKPILQTVDLDLGLHHSFQQSPSLIFFTGYPVTDEHAITFPESFASFSYGDFHFPQQTVRVFNLHLQSYGIGVLPGHRSRIPEICARLYRGLLMRCTQAETVAASNAASPNPVIVCGDFNDVPLSYTYRVISHGLTDGFRSAGWGSGVSYSGPFPLVRIDYILCSPSLRISNYTAPYFGFSDHHPGVCDLDLTH
jgi:hypothetical protein